MTTSTSPTTPADPRPFGGVFDGKPAAPPEPDQVLLTHTSRLQDMAEKAEQEYTDAMARARAWEDYAQTQDRLALGYRKALEYLEAQARTSRDRPEDEPR